MLAIAQLSPATAPSYAPFTYRQYRPWLLDEHHPIAQRLIAFGARLGDEPVGLVVAGIEEDGQEATLCSVFVKEAHRRAGVGAALFEALEAACRAQGIRRLATRFHEVGDMTALRRLLSRAGWEAPSLITRYYRFALQPLQEARWLARWRAPSRYRLLPWDQVPPAVWDEAERALDHETDNPDYFRPSRKAQPIVSACSYALFEGDELIGWSLVDQEIPGTLYYRALFIRPPYRGKGLGIALAAATSRGALNSGASHGVLQVLEENLEMQKVLKRLVLPLQPRVTAYFETGRDL
ncbi:GNAT family N-acetyltransferase [bacterium]|nr:GNAT family N-acetyltransferase [bacterium]